MTGTVLSEGIVSQLKRNINENLPVALKGMASRIKGFDIENEISNIVEQYLIQRVYIETSYLEKSKTPDPDALKKFIKKKKYHIEKLSEELKQEYESAKNGVPVLSPVSPYNESALVIVRATAKVQREATIERTFNVVDEFMQRIGDIPPIRKGESAFVGFYEYPFFSLLCAGDEKRAAKLLKIDIEEYALRLSFSHKYEEFAYYPAETVGKAFYGETVKSKKVDEEYELVSSQYLKDTFFPKEIGVKQVSIDAKKPWDDRDSKLFSYLCTKCVSQKIEGKDVLIVEGNIRELCKALFPETTSYGSKFYTLARNRLLNMGRTSVVAVLENDVIISRNIFEQTVIDGREDSEESGKSGGAFFHVEFGRNVSADILSHHLSTIIRPRLDELENPVSRFLYMQLKKDRAMDLYLSKGKTRHQYTLIWLMLIYRVRDAKKAARIGRYTEALTEMRDKGLLIKWFNVSEDRFEIEWLPLSEDERMDIKAVSSVHVQEAIDVN